MLTAFGQINDEYTGTHAESDLVYLHIRPQVLFQVFNHLNKQRSGLSKRQRTDINHLNPAKCV